VNAWDWDRKPRKKNQAHASDSEEKQKATKQAPASKRKNAFPYGGRNSRARLRQNEVQGQQNREADQRLIKSGN
jgi:hypothetical protein